MIKHKLKKIFRIPAVDNFIRNKAVPGLIKTYIDIVFFTSKINVFNRENYIVVKNKTHVFACWHGQQFAAVYTHRDEDITVLVSPSRDGNVQHSFLNKLGYSTIRGSSDKNPVKSIITMIRDANRNQNNFAFAVDGPKGPLHKVKSGIGTFAQKTGYAIVPIISNFKNKIVVSSWDKAMLPLPFTTISIIYGKPVTISKDCNVEEKIKKCENNMIFLTELSEKLI